MTDYLVRGYLVEITCDKCGEHICWEDVDDYGTGDKYFCDKCAEELGIPDLFKRQETI